MTRSLPERAKEALENATPGPWEGRAVYGGVPAEPCEFGTISLVKGIETARIWNLEDARLIALTPELARAVVAAEELAECVESLLETLRLQELRGGYESSVTSQAGLTEMALRSLRKATGGGS